MVSPPLFFICSRDFVSITMGDLLTLLIAEYMMVVFGIKLCSAIAVDSLE